MQRIKFKTLSLGKYSLALILLAIILIAAGGGLFSNYNNAELFIVGLLIILFEISRFFWYKNFVQHNKTWIIIKLNSTFPRIFKFKDIKEINVTKTHFILKLNSGKIKNFLLARIDRNDVDDFADIILDNSNATYINEGMHDEFIKKRK